MVAQNWGSKLLGQWQGEKYRGCKFVSSAIHTKFKEHNNMWPFFPLPALAVARTNLQVRVQCFILALKKGSNNLASGSIFCSPSIFYWGHRQFLSTCSCSSTMYMCILYYTMYILSTSYVLLRYVLQQLETGNPTIKKINQLSHGNINEDTRSSSTQYILPS